MDHLLVAMKVQEVIIQKLQLAAQLVQEVQLTVDPLQTAQGLSQDPQPVITLGPQTEVNLELHQDHQDLTGVLLI